MDIICTDLAIVGGSIASSCFLQFLDDSGLSAVVIEKKQFPRRKACGEGMSSLVYDVLSKAGHQDLFLQSDLMPLEGYRFNFTDWSFSIGSAGGSRIFGVDRAMLDSHLSERVRPLCKIISCQASEAFFQDGLWSIRAGDSLIQAKFLIAADGNSGGTARSIGIKRVSKSRARYSLSSWWQMEQAGHLSRVEIFPEGSACTYVTRVSDQSFNVTVLGTKEDIQKLAEDISPINNKLKGLGLQAQHEGAVLGSSQFNSRSECYKSNKFLTIGDAAESYDPASGLGMYHAVFSALLAAHAVKAFFAGDAESPLKYSQLLNGHNKFLRFYDSIILGMMRLTRRQSLLKLFDFCGIIKIVDILLSFLLRANLAISYMRTVISFNQKNKIRVAPVIFGIVTFIAFLAAVILMNFRLFVGMEVPFLDLHLSHPLLFDFVLLLQFPLFHSLLLGRGRRALSFFSKNALFNKLSVTTYVFFSSLQLLLVFLLWQFSGVEYYVLNGIAFWVFTALFCLSNLYLARAMYDAGLGVQLGTAGWMAAASGNKVKYPPMPSSGTFRYCRQPIYLAFFLILWLSPILTLDKLLLASCWSLYCIAGPLLKERRFAEKFGRQFSDYKKKTPYFLPKFFSCRK